MFKYINSLERILSIPALVLALISVSYASSIYAADYDGMCMNAPAVALRESSNIVRVSSEAALQRAMRNIESDTVVLIAPGEYFLSNTLVVKDHHNVTIRGDSDRCDEIILIGKGMENADGKSIVPHGIWTNSRNLSVQNLTIKDVYYHAIAIDGRSEAPHIYNVRMLDTGQQFVKASSVSFGIGADNGKVEYSIMKYLNGPPVTDHGGGTGYTNGVDVHGGENWLVSNNRFENFHTPDAARHRWNPVILIWNGASDSRIENNTFVDVDRAIALGLVDRNNDHTGGIVVNNMIYLRSGLFSASRKQSSDGLILIWNSPGTHVLHNTVMTQGNTNSSIQLRYDSSGAVIRNNLISAPITDRGDNDFEQSGNVQTSDVSIFTNTYSGDLHLIDEVSGITGAVDRLEQASRDFDGHLRKAGQLSDAGADEIMAVGECTVRSTY